VVRVKICGITSLADAELAVEAGADALGFIFVENTPRFVTPAQVRPIVRALPPFVTPVGVFWDHPAGHVKAVAESCGLAALQFHGDETPEELAGYALPVIKTLKVPPAVEGLASWGVDPARYAGCAAALLLDSAARWSEGEARQPIAWQIARELGARAPAAGRDEGWTIILAAGLTPDNVGRAVAAGRPYAVDVNSGVEVAPGRKDPVKVRRFVVEAKRGS
jgi:phosphoribosylanthranilate isomerase